MNILGLSIKEIRSIGGEAVCQSVTVIHLCSGKVSKIPEKCPASFMDDPFITGQKLFTPIPLLLIKCLESMKEYTFLGVPLCNYEDI